MGNVLVFPGRELGHLDKRRVSSFQQMAFSPAGSFPGFKDTQLFWLLFHSKIHVSILNNLANQMGCFLIPFLKKRNRFKLFSKRVRSEAKLLFY